MDWVGLESRTCCGVCVEKLPDFRRILLARGKNDTEKMMVASVGADFSWKVLFVPETLVWDLRKAFCLRPMVRKFESCKKWPGSSKIMGQDDDQVRPHGHYSGWFWAVTRSRESVPLASKYRLAGSRWSDRRRLVAATRPFWAILESLLLETRKKIYWRIELVWRVELVVVSV